MLGIKSAWLQQRLEGNVESALVHTECQLDALQVLRCGCLTCLPKLILPVAEGPANELLVLPIAIHGLQHQERCETSNHWAAPCNHALFICWVHPHLLPKTGVLRGGPARGDMSARGWCKQRLPRKLLFMARCVPRLSAATFNSGSQKLRLTDGMLLFHPIIIWRMMNRLSEALLGLLVFLWGRLCQWLGEPDTICSIHYLQTEGQV